MAKKASGTIYPLSALTAIVLHSQLLTTPNGASSTPDTMVDLVTALGYVQIDTLHVVNRELVNQALARIRSEGGLRVGDFEYDGPQRGVWYEWKPPKMALGALFAWGDLMVAERVNFQRVYDVKERVLPEWVDTTPVPAGEARRFCLEQAAKALGVFDCATSSHGMARRVSRLRRAIRQRSAKK